MQKKLFSLVSLLLVLIMVAAVFAGCGAQNNSGQATTQDQSQAQSQAASSQAPAEPKIDTSKHVDLVMYGLGEAPKGFDQVMTEVNNKMQKDINATLKINLLSWGDYDKKYPLLLASGETFDLIYTADWCYFVDQAQKGGFMALDDLMPKYAPQTLAALPKEAIDASKINGKMYMIPSLIGGFQEVGYLVRGDLMKKYGMTDIKTIDDFGTYLNNVAKNEKGMIPYNAGSNDAGMLNSVLVNEKDWSYTGFAGGVFSKIADPKDIFAWYFTPEFADFAAKMKTFADNGYWSKNVLSNKMTAKDAMINGKSAAAITNLDTANEAYKSIIKDHPDWDPQWFHAGPDTAVERTSYRSDAMAVPASSKNPERALMALELLKNNEDYFDLTYYGIKGTNYDLNDKNQIVIGSNETAYSGADISVWGWGNDKLVKYPADMMPSYQPDVDAMSKIAAPPAYASFAFNHDSIKSELAAIADVQTQYGVPLTWGLMPNVTDGIKNLEDKLKTAGIDTVLAEAKKQAADYWTSQGK